MTTMGAPCEHGVTMGLVRIAVVSRDRLYCEGLCQILRRDPTFDVVAVDEEHDSKAATGVDIRVVDVSGGVPLTGVASDGQGPHVIAVNAPEDDAWAVDMLGAGVRGILSHACGADELAKAIRVVHEGGLWAPRRWLTTYVQGKARPPRQHVDPEAVHELDALLSRREREVFRHAATGMGNKELADRLAISEATVKSHLTRIYRKVGVTGRAELAAAYHGLRLLTTGGSYDVRRKPH
jgi:DNA-binding NarL/FixJ family response regulator